MISFLLTQPGSLHGNSDALMPPLRRRVNAGQRSDQRATKMIAYDLQCINGHCFEGWFEDEATYLDQKEKGMIACPTCNQTGVARIPSVFAIKTATTASTPNETAGEMTGLGQRIVDYINKNFDDVGCDFAKEALKMHYGVAHPRNIRGTSTKEEEETLKKEGIEFLKIPLPQGPDTDS